jgi:hypothetical protein
MGCPLADLALGARSTGGCPSQTSRLNEVVNKRELGDANRIKLQNTETEKERGRGKERE